MSSVKLEIKGFDELIDKLHKYHDTPNKVGNKALKEAAEVMLKHEKSTLRSMHSGDRSTGKGAANLKVGKLKTYPSGSKFVGVGFTKEMMGGGDNWKNIKGAYFQHYGYYNHRGGKYVAGSNWLGVAYENGANPSYAIIKNTIIAELNSIG